MFELQYHTPESFELKNGALHTLYEQQRVLTDTMSAKYLGLRDEMMKLSEKLEFPESIKELNSYGN
jgi:hypothetical protein